MSSDEKGIQVLRIGLGHVKLTDYVASDELLCRSPLIGALSDDERNALLCKSRVQSLDAGSTILVEGQESDNLFFVLEGNVVLSAKDGMTDLGSLEKGDFFGLSAIEPSAVRPGARAQDSVRLAILPAEEMKSLAAGNPQIGKVFEDTVRQRKKLAEEGDDFLDRW